MNRFRCGWIAATLLTVAAQSACSSATKGAGSTVTNSPILSQAELLKGRNTTAAPPSPADVEFLQGMIPHHAQAVVMAGWAESHGARPDVRALCERIVVGQRDEIALMQYWLRTHGARVPDATNTKMTMKMGGMDMPTLMPGMLTDEQLAALDKARGSEWDRLFLQGMIGHHEGAVAMVNVLLGSQNPANDDMVYKMASDVYADQTTEIETHDKNVGNDPGSDEVPVVGTP